MARLMRSNPLPTTLKAWPFADAAEQLQGELASAAMPRLLELVDEASAAVSLSLQGGIDDHDIRFLTGQARVNVTLLCQRCLEPLNLALLAEFKLGLIRDEQALIHLPGEYEPLLCPETLDLTAMVEDELILALPTIPRHAMGSACEQAFLAQQRNLSAAAAQDSANHPFAALSGWLKDE